MGWGAAGEAEGHRDHPGRVRTRARDDAVRIERRGIPRGLIDSESAVGARRLLRVRNPVLPRRAPRGGDRDRARAHIVRAAGGRGARAPGRCRSGGDAVRDQTLVPVIARVARGLAMVCCVATLQGCMRPKPPTTRRACARPSHRERATGGGRDRPASYPTPRSASALRSNSRTSSAPGSDPHGTPSACASRVRDERRL